MFALAAFFRFPHIFSFKVFESLNCRSVVTGAHHSSVGPSGFVLWKRSKKTRYICCWVRAATSMKTWEETPPFP